MAEYSSPYMGLKIIVKHEQKVYATGTGTIINTIPAKIARFSDGRYRTEDPEIIKILDEKSTRNPDVLMRIDRALNRVTEIQRALRAKWAEYEEEKKKAGIKDTVKNLSQMPAPENTDKHDKLPPTKRELPPEEKELAPDVTEDDEEDAFNEPASEPVVKKKATRRRRTPKA